MPPWASLRTSGLRKVHISLDFTANIVAYNAFVLTEAKKDLKASRVKVRAKDVMLSKKILFAMVAVPILWLSYGAMLFLFTPLETRTIVIIILCCPIFSYLGVQAVEVHGNWSS